MVCLLLTPSDYFSFCSLDWIISTDWPISMFTDSSACSDMLMKPLLSSHFRYYALQLQNFCLMFNLFHDFLPFWAYLGKWTESLCLVRSVSVPPQERYWLVSSVGGPSSVSLRFLPFVDSGIVHTWHVVTPGVRFFLFLKTVFVLLWATAA